MPRFWKNQERNDSAPHRIALGFNMLYAIPPALGKITIKSLFFLENRQGVFNVNPVSSLWYRCPQGLMWTPLMVNIYEIRPSHSDAVAMAGLTGPD